MTPLVVALVPCPFCLEMDCDLFNNGSRPCEGADEYAAAVEQMNESPVITMRRRAEK